MIIFLRVLAVLVLVIVVLFVLAGVTGPSKSQFTITEQVNSPVTVVWQAMTNPDKIAEWNSDLSRVEMTGDGNLSVGTEYISYFRADRNQVFSREKVTKFNADQQITLAAVTGTKKSLLTNFEKDYRFKSLLDGSTEIAVTISYRPAGYFARAVDKIYLLGRMNMRYNRQLLSLKRFIEKL